MASRILVRKKRYFVDYLTVHLQSTQSFYDASPGRNTQYFDTRSLSSLTSFVSSNINHVNEGDAFSFANAENHATEFSALGVYRSIYYGIGSPASQNGRQNNRLPMAIALKLHPVCHASTATAGQPDYDDEENEELAAKKKKEASPEECDQAVVGLSAAKAKVKAKLQDSQNGAKSVLGRVWVTLLGIGPALRAIASMSRLVVCCGA